MAKTEEMTAEEVTAVDEVASAESALTKATAAFEAADAAVRNIDLRSITSSDLKQLSDALTQAVAAQEAAQHELDIVTWDRDNKHLLTVVQTAREAIEAFATSEALAGAWAAGLPSFTVIKTEAGFTVSTGEVDTWEYTYGHEWRADCDYCNYQWADKYER